VKQPNVESITIRLEATHESQKRTRLALFVSIIISLSLITVCWNAYLSWYRGFLLHDSFSPNPVTEFAQKQLIADWIRSREVSVPLLGIYVAVSDASILGSLSMLIVSVWFWFCARQENQTIGRLLIETQNADASRRALIFLGITSYMVFTTVSQHDGPIKTLKTRLASPIAVSVQFSLEALVFLAPFSVAFLIAVDLLSLFVLEPLFRYPHSESLYHNMTKREWLWYGIATAISLIIVTTITMLAYSIVQYVRGTASALQEYSNSLEYEEHDANIRVQVLRCE
jgi:hypothetical protein